MTKLDHESLSSDDIVDAIGLSRHVYNDLAGFDFDGDRLSELNAEWRVVTDDLRLYGLTIDNLDPFSITTGSYFAATPVIPIAEAVVALYQNVAHPDTVAVVFRGTDGLGDVAIDLSASFPAYYNLFSPFVDSMVSLLNSGSISGTTIQNVIVTGHSLGAAMAEYFMDDIQDLDIRDDVSVNAVTFASPEASLDRELFHDVEDGTILNIGHENDLVYSIVGTRGGDDSDSVSNLYLLHDVTNIGNLSFSFRSEHSSYYYDYTTRILLSSQFYEETTRTSHVLVNLSTSRESVIDQSTSWLVDDSYLVLGRDGATILSDGTILSGDDWLVAGDGNDWLEGFAGNDTLEGDVNDGPFAGGNDTMSGGEGQDTFLGKPEDLNGDTITDLEVGDFIQLKGVATSDISDDFDYSVSGGVVTLSFDEGILDIGGTTVNITMDIPKGAALTLLEDRPEATIEVVAKDGHDIAFVVDTTGSMWDDIDAVQAQATSIINAIFDPARGLLNSRVAVVGYNDPGTETLLSFTDHDDVEDRKQAALDAINALYATGGGDFEEMVYSGLLRALDGRAGEWREDALASRIFLFGDAPAKDTELLDRVLELAADVGADVSVSASTFAMSESVSRTTLTMAAASSESDPISVEIFTIVVGGDETTRDEFELLASETGGEALTSADATEIADVLFDAIQSGTAGNDIIIGNSRGNDLDGKSGDDSITGNDGDDTLSGGSGNDTVMGGAGSDRILDGLGNNILDGGDDDDSIQALSGVNSLQGGSGSDYLAGGFQADTLSGGEGNDVLRGDTGKFLGGSDILIGGANDDFLMGGRGADTFVFYTNHGSDIIAAFDVADLGYGPLSGYTATATGADFQAGVDHILLDDFSGVNASNVMGFVSDSADGARFSAEGTDILFYGVAASQISADDFLFGNAIIV